MEALVLLEEEERGRVDIACERVALSKGEGLAASWTDVDGRGTRLEVPWGAARPVTERKLSGLPVLERYIEAIWRPFTACLANPGVGVLVVINGSPKCGESLVPLSTGRFHRRDRLCLVQKAKLLVELI